MKANNVAKRNGEMSVFTFHLQDLDVHCQVVQLGHRLGAMSGRATVKTTA
jgi:hypothetical protein